MGRPLKAAAPYGSLKAAAEGTGTAQHGPTKTEPYSRQGDRPLGEISRAMCTASLTSSLCVFLLFCFVLNSFVRGVLCFVLGVTCSYISFEV